MTRAALQLTSYVLGLAVALAILLAWTVVAAGCGGAIADEGATNWTGTTSEGMPEAGTPSPPVSSCDADARDYRAVCASQGAPSGFAYVGACLRELPPSGYPRNDLFGPDSGGGVPFDSTGLHSQFIGGCRGVSGYADWRNDVICCP